MFIIWKKKQKEISKYSEATDKKQTTRMRVFELDIMSMGYLKTAF